MARRASLIAEIVATKVDISKNDYVSLYDPTCGGANLLFGVADRLRNEGGYQFVATYGQDFNDALSIVEKIGTKIERLKQLKRSLVNEVITGQRAINTSE